jgi:hypothetical protein
LAGTPDYKVKIDIDGKLKLYWVYDPVINATWFSGWNDPRSMIIGLIADSVNQGVLSGGLQAEIAGVTVYVNDIQSISSRPAADLIPTRRRVLQNCANPDEKSAWKCISSPRVPCTNVVLHMEVNQVHMSGEQCSSIQSRNRMCL